MTSTGRDRIRRALGTRKAKFITTSTINKAGLGTCIAVFRGCQLQLSSEASATEPRGLVAAGSHSKDVEADVNRNEKLAPQCTGHAVLCVFCWQASVHVAKDVCLLQLCMVIWKSATQKVELPRARRLLHLVVVRSDFF